MWGSQRILPGPSLHSGGAWPVRRCTSTAMAMWCAGPVAHTHSHTRVRGQRALAWGKAAFQHYALYMGHVARRREAWPTVAMKTWRPQRDSTVRLLRGLARRTTQHMAAETARAVRQGQQLWACRAAGSDRGAGCTAQPFAECGATSMVTHPMRCRTGDESHEVGVVRACIVWERILQGAC